MRSAYCALRAVGKRLRTEGDRRRGILCMGGWHPETHGEERSDGKKPVSFHAGCSGGHSQEGSPAGDANAPIMGFKLHAVNAEAALLLGVRVAWTAAMRLPDQSRSAGKQPPPRQVSNDLSTLDFPSPNLSQHVTGFLHQPRHQPRRIPMPQQRRSLSRPQ